MEYELDNSWPRRRQGGAGGRGTEPEHLATGKGQRRTGGDREYNGMWPVQDLARALPGNWVVYQTICTADGTTFRNLF